MEQLDLENIDYNELYKIHTGHGIYDSDSDSSDFVASTFLEQHKPPLYTCEELKANLVVIEVENEKSEASNINGPDVGNKALKSEKSSKETQDEILKKLILPHYCYVCYADLSTPHNADSHYNSKRHIFNVKYWKASEIKSPEEIVQDKLQELICSDYCYICYADLQQQQNANSHYNSNRHKNNLDIWKRTEIEKLKLPNNLMASKKVESSEEDAFQKPTNQNDTGISDNNQDNNTPILKEFCSVCGIITGTTLQDHYKSDLHKRCIETFCFICNLKTNSKEHLAEHMKQTGHHENLGRKQESNNLTIPKTITTPVIEKATPVESSEEMILQKKLKKLLCSDYCYICCADLPQSQNFNSHYNSDRHKNNLVIWKSTETKRLRSLDVNSLVVSKPVAIQKEAEEKNPERLEITASIKHKTEPESSVKIVKPNINLICRVCGINVHTGFQEHYNSDLHKRSVETFCFVCNIRTSSKEQLAEHVKGTSHMNKLGTQGKEDNNLNIPETISTKEDKTLIMESTQAKVTNKTSLGPLIPRSCNICNIKFGNDNIAKEHYKSINHQRKVEISQAATQGIPKSVPARWCYCNMCKMPLNGTEEAEGHYKEPAHIIKNIGLYCHICKKTFASKMEMDFHVNTFPHNEVSKLKSLTVSIGISTQEFWKQYEYEIECNLCIAIIQSESSACDHFGSKRHRDNFDRWCCNQIKDTKDPNRRWYFCDICDQHLDGTTNIELHYQGIQHANNLKGLKVVSGTVTDTKQTPTIEAYNEAVDNAKKFETNWHRACEDYKALKIKFEKQSRQLAEQKLQLDKLIHQDTSQRAQIQKLISENSELVSKLSRQNKEYSNYEQVTSPNKSADDTKKETEDEKKGGISKTQPEEMYINSIKPVSENQNLNTKMTNNKIISDINNKKREEMEQRCEDSELQIEKTNMNYSNSKSIIENQNLNTNITNNKINSDGKNKKQEETEHSKLQIERTEGDYSNSTKPIKKNQNFNINMTNNKIHSDSEYKKQEETEHRYDDSNLQIVKTNIDCSNSTKPVIGSQNLNIKITNNKIHSDSENIKQQEQTEPRCEDCELPTESIRENEDLIPETTGPNQLLGCCRCSLL